MAGRGKMFIQPILAWSLSKKINSILLQNILYNKEAILLLFLSIVSLAYSNLFSRFLSFEQKFITTLLDDDIFKFPPNALT